MATITPMFALPFAFSQHPQPEGLNAALRALFLEREAQGDRFANPNPNTPRNAALFESHFDLFAWPEASVAALREFCLQELLSVVAHLSGYDAAFTSRLRVQADAWFHITRRGGHFGVHNHPMASWSGVYCVSHDRQPGEAGTADDSGRLSFMHPNGQAFMYIDPGNAHLGRPFGSSNRGFDLVPGQLVLFPSWVQHYVMPFQGAGERITVAFNCRFEQMSGST